MLSDRDRDKIVGEFETMKSFELAAHDLYAQIAADPRVVEPKVKDTFARLAREERYHAQLAQEIIDLIRKAR